jgi:hypothetical protein
LRGEVLVFSVGVCLGAGLPLFATSFHGVAGGNGIG